MTKQELIAKMQEGQAWVPGKRVKIDFGDEGAVMLDGAANQVSEDDTGALVAAIAARDSRVRMLDSAPLADGWFGKQWAC